jgi:hypothetical protein
MFFFRQNWTTAFVPSLYFRRETPLFCPPNWQKKNLQIHLSVPSSESRTLKKNLEVMGRKVESFRDEFKNSFLIFFKFILVAVRNGLTGTQAYIQSFKFIGAVIFKATTLYPDGIRSLDPELQSPIWKTEMIQPDHASRAGFILWIIS